MSERLVASTAQKSNMALLPPPSCGPTIHRRYPWDLVRYYMGGGGGDGPRQPRPGLQRLTLGTWNVTSLGGKEPELVWEVERWIWWGLSPHSWLGAGHYSSPELPKA